MPPKEPTRHQLSSRLAYSGKTPSFLLKLQNQVAGRTTRDDEDEPQYLDDGVDEFGRERRDRPAIPERPENDERGSDGEDDADEKPVVVVLREGKHLTEFEAKNERRRAEGLPPLPPEPDVLNTSASPRDSTPGAPLKLPEPSGLSFSSKRNKEPKVIGSKRKVPSGDDKSEDIKQRPKTKKAKKGQLSFDQDDLG